MIRRSPTRIELRLDDLQEYETMRKEHELKKESDKQGTFIPTQWTGLLQSEIHERIGYVPQQSQNTHSRPNI